jgi:hypothetical protein
MEWKTSIACRVETDTQIVVHGGRASGPRQEETRAISPGPAYRWRALVKSRRDENLSGYT